MGKIAFILVIIFIAYPSLAQFPLRFDSVLTEDLNWLEDTNHFDVVSNQLRLYAPDTTSQSSISFQNQTISNVSWQITFGMDFSPSSSNRLRLYPVSDHPNPEKASNAYFIEIGESGDQDAVHFYKRLNGTNELLFTGQPVLGIPHDSITLKIDHFNSEWTVALKLNTEKSFTPQGTFIDSSIQSTQYFGWTCFHTKTRIDKFWFDNIDLNGTFLKDTIAPQLISQSITENQIILSFNEPIESIENLLLNGSTTEFLIEGSAVFIPVYTLLQEADNILELTNTSDLSGNTRSEVLVFDNHKMEYGDILITEFLPDPVPSVGLPEVEYYEIYNTTDFTLDLRDLQLSDRTKTIHLKPYLLKPHEYLILTKSSINDSVSQLILTDLPSLNNAGDSLSLVFNELVIDWVRYDESWFSLNPEKSLGGYAFERICDTCICNNKYDWEYSQHPTGGTPGFKHQNKSTRPNHQLDLNYFIREDTVYLHSPELFLFSNWSITEGHELVFSPRNETLGETLTVTTCTGAHIDTTFDTFLPSQIVNSNDLIITELLFNPLPDYYDYIELYNPTASPIDLSTIGIFNPEKEDTFSISAKPYYLHPQEYVVLTPDLKSFLSYWPDTKRIIEIELPIMNNDEGQLQFTTENEVFTTIHYSESNHSNFLSSYEQISLENRSDHQQPTPELWTSASSLSNFGTPGYPNTAIQSGSSSYFNCPSEGITADIERDFTWSFELGNYVATIEFHRLDGTALNKPLNNELVGCSESFSWQAADEPPGIYMAKWNFTAETGMIYSGKCAFTIEK